MIVSNMANELTFKNLPFVPVEGQVIYVEQSYNKKLNEFICANYDWLKATFRDKGLEFCYLPLLAKEALSYHAPYITDDELNKRLANIPSLANYVVHGNILKPSLVFALDTPVKDIKGNVVLQAVGITIRWFRSTKSTFISLVKDVKKVAQSQSAYYREIERRRLAEKVRTNSEGERAKDDQSQLNLKKPHDVRVKYSINESLVNGSTTGLDLNPSHNPSGYTRNRPVRENPEEADNNFDTQSLELIGELKLLIKSLRNRGVNTMILHDIIDEGERLSRLRITSDFRMFLIDYDNLEIKLPELPKAVFFLFLRHPEGIRFKELPDYYSELLEIYRKMNPIGGRFKHEQSIRDITNPCNNSINEKCARIREAFVSNFDDRLAKNYYVTGKRGEAKRVILDKSMVIWE